MAEVKWIKIATDMFEDEKIMLVESSDCGELAIVIWIKILTLAGKLNNGGLLASTEGLVYDTKNLAKIFKKSEKKIKKIVEILKNFGLIEEINGIFLIKKWEKNQNLDGLEKIREQGKKRAAKHRAKQKLLAEENENEEESNVTDNVTDNVTVTDGNATEQETEEETEEDTCSSSSLASSENSIYDRFEDEFQKMLTPSEMKSIDRLVFTYGEDMVEKALDESVLKGKPTLGYITGILKNWSLSKITTLGDRLAEKESQQVNAVKRPRLSRASKEEEEERRMREKWGF